MNELAGDSVSVLASTIRASMEAACEPTEEPWGFVVRNHDFPRIHRANFVWLRSLPVGGLKEVLSRADEVFGPGIPHRAIYVDDSSLAAEMRTALGRLGFAFRASDLMVARERPRPRVNPRVTLRAADDEEVRRDHDVVSRSIFREEGYEPEVTQQLLALHWRRFQELDREAYVAYVDGAPAGNIGLDIAGNVGLIYDVATAPAMRRRGVATTMVDFILSRAEALSLTLLGLETIQEREVWQIYETMGFARVGILAKFHRQRPTSEA